MTEVREALSSPLALILVTLLSYQAGLWLRHRTRGHALAQPVVVSIAGTVAALLLLDVDYSAYADDARLISFWLGPATVALAVPLHRQTSRLRGVVRPMLVAIPVGAVVSILTAYGLVVLCGGAEVLALTMSPKAATTPISIALSEQVGGVPALTAIVTIVAGILGAILGPAVLTLARVRDERARGLAMGASAHGIGTSRALAESETQGAFSGLSMGLTALATSVLLPLVLWLL